MADKPVLDAAASPFGHWSDKYRAALATHDLRRSRALVREAAEAGTSPARLYVDVMRPVLAATLGRTESDTMTLEQRVAVASAQAALTDIGSMPVAGCDMHGGGGVALVSVGRRLLDGLDAQVIVDLLRADGWRVIEVPATAPAAVVVNKARKEAARLVVMPTSNPTDLLLAARTYKQLHLIDPAPLIIAVSFGGGEEARARSAGADAYVSDPDALLAAVNV